MWYIGVMPHQPRESDIRQAVLTLKERRRGVRGLHAAEPTAQKLLEAQGVRVDADTRILHLYLLASCVDVMSTNGAGTRMPRPYPRIDSACPQAYQDVDERRPVTHGYPLHYNHGPEENA